ncbi:Glycosyltransferase family 4 protein [Sulfidibacter corallicola]|uniref:Glycosyltransferase family 4 protein n=1 Tax=Sulfidibacter corallicola TaxID=2818388 RepID=A0A8A4U530_SULCO|nr:glycosyltransferase family 4 protein [Sulfidibacter corallicola]QTD53855.1 glycosyltransferase family 4 protein [Sulfidibacter corallicola]
MMNEWMIPSMVFVVSMLGTGWLAVFLRRRGQVDVPNERSSHRVPTPRGGGLAVIFALVLGFEVTRFVDQLPFDGFFYVALALVSLMGYLDDKYRLSPMLRLVIYFSAAAIITFSRSWIDLIPLPPPFNLDWGWWRYPMSMIWIVGVLNLTNFLDGIDGYLGVQTVIVGLGLCLLFQTETALQIGMILIAAALGFLVHNWHPAKIFLGDVGSVSLGFIFAVTPFYLGGGPIEYRVFLVGMLLWFFLSDGTFTIVRRLIAGEKIWNPHHKHLYQRLTEVGWSHRRIVAVVLAMQVTVLVSLQHFAARPGFGQWWVVALVFVLFGCYFGLVLAVEARHKRRKKVADSGS